MADKIQQYVAQSFQEAVYGRKPRPDVRPMPNQRLNGDFRKGNQMFLGLHPNKSVVEKPMAVPHKHSYVELVYVHKGRMSQRIDGKVLQCEEGSLSLLNPNIVHQPWVETKDDIVVNIGVKHETIEKVISLITGENQTYSHQINQICTAENPGKQEQFLFVADARQFEEVIGDMFGEYFNRGYLYDQKIVLDFMYLLLQLHRGTLDTDEDGFSTEDIINYIDKHYAKLNMEKLSQHFNYSQRQMRRILRTITDESLPVMINRKKIEKACEYIERHQMPTDRILDHIGFQNAHYFYDTFKSIVGISLSDYREAVTAGQAKNGKLIIDETSTV